MSALRGAAREFFERRRVVHLATADETGAPSVVPICFAVVDQTIYLAIDEKPKSGAPRDLRRVRNILANPRVAVVADVYDDANWSQLGWVLVRGPARVLDAGAEYKAALEALRTKYAQYRTMALGDRPVIAIDITRTTTWGDLSA